MVSRRALLGAGALLLVGCGPADEPKINTSEVWKEQLRVSQEALVAYADDDALRKDASARTLLVGGALERAGGVDEDLSKPSGTSPLLAEQAALRAHVAAVGVLSDAASREVLAKVIAGSAAAVAALQAREDEPAIASFPGQPVDP